MLRYERKYYVPNNKLLELRKRLLPFVNPDAHSKITDEGLTQYTVRSIYYDTPFMDFYYEKMEGLENRNKFRIRVYDNYKPGNVAFLEIKQKLGPRIKKYRSPLNIDNVKDLLSEGDIEKYINSRPTDASKFLFHYYRNSLKPVSLVVYDREAYHGKFDHGVRITFDKNVRTLIYPKLKDIYYEKSLKPITPEFFVLEIKYFYEMPAWARSIVEEFDLKLEAISKYSTGIDIHHINSKIRFSPIGFSRMSEA
jgi:SPX domain protein involved in polyphosphate accumulation